MCNLWRAGHSSLCYNRGSMEQNEQHSPRCAITAVDPADMLIYESQINLTLMLYKAVLATVCRVELLSGCAFPFLAEVKAE